MPKIIENLRGMLLAEARRQIAENGYVATTIRSVAAGCGVGVGTVYNYFPSKDVLIASYMLEDWQQRIATMQQAIGGSPDPDTVVGCICHGLREFAATHSRLFSDEEAARVFASVFSERHKQLRAQVAVLLAPVCAQSAAENKAFLAEFIAESLLTWTMAGRSTADIYSVVRLLLF